jgi:hypothetical protein
LFTGVARVLGVPRFAGQFWQAADILCDNGADFPYGGAWSQTGRPCLLLFVFILWDFSIIDFFCLRISVLLMFNIHGV